ncbi:L-serine ammonia-lyase, iron-sulfur-dependent, subunit alpha [uncultured Anaerococcus sp.]|uniref:L-serine ammonia-lyase, iron-sulfur-dependent, subunit alpha n=1 Tax=uncultured Anaerococcus sp. TaxID=293428 RepID=UPI0025D266E9|nr:L-serine ammonia-lyase, iron-sulfur-dependent, subunit alpha [uncultured Anaerococcus sp.]
MLTTMKLLKERSKEENLNLWQLAIKDEIENTGKTEEEIFERLQKTLDVMKASAERALDEDVRSVTGMTGGNAKKMHEYFLGGKSVLGETPAMAMAFALSTSEVNAAMGRIVAAPTAGSAGIIPATMMTMMKKYNFDDRKLCEALLVSTQMGQVIFDNATFAGAEGGCQAETGAAAAMAAAAVCYLQGYDIEIQENAATAALLNIMGLICDPIGGMVEFPCNLRNANGIMNALASADMAMAGVEMFVTFDEAVEAMKRVGDTLPERLRETGEGGIAVCPSSIRLKKKYIDKLPEEEVEE